MKKIILLSLCFSSLFSVSYSTFLSSNKENYMNSTVYIDGRFSSYRCTKDRRVNGNRVDGYCKVQLDAYELDNFIGHVAVYVGTTWESDFKNSSKGDSFSFSCTYRGNYYSFKGCR